MVTVLKEIPTLFEKFGVARGILDKISLWRGDITKLEVDAIVNAANSGLAGGDFYDAHSRLKAIYISRVDSVSSLEFITIMSPSANHVYAAGGGVDGAIHRAAGTKDLQKECRAIGHCDTGAAVITSACNIKHVKNIIHTVGPICHGALASEGEREKLKSCYHSCLDLAVKNNLKTAFCCISTGVYGYPQDDAAKTVVGLLTDWLAKPENAAKIARIVLVLFNPADVSFYEKFFEDYAKTQK
ncbi:unnamed protein product [Strongylus vulgaris]|uniref:Macro domain-containing protein n=1 Tax=Strongylus vulgaris TaxID=40348 RepID=A0A3P7IC48_STRVU|nr:unnamed protein product [Strongylus vulgaris]